LRSLILFSKWFAQELGLEIDLSPLDSGIQNAGPTQSGFLNEAATQVRPGKRHPR
jgi:hypothetical protein